MDFMQVINNLHSFITEGGVFMWFIIGMWAIGIAISIERFTKLAFIYDIDGTSFMSQLQKHIISNDIQAAIRACSGSMAAVPKVLKSGLKRANQSNEQIQNAIDATALEMIPKVERRLPYLSTIANIATLLGLLGTIQGLMQSFTAISEVDPSQKAQVLALGISKAMNTTALGLFAAITIMMIHAFLSSKAEKIVSEVDEFSVKLQDILGTKQIIDESSES